MKRKIDCSLLQFIFDENLENENCIFVNLYGNSEMNVYTKFQAKKLVDKLEKALPILREWVDKVGRIVAK